MATKKEIMRQLLKGVNWNEAARSLGCSKATVARCAAKMEHSNREWVGSRRHVVLCSASGCGKTWLACALGVAACNAFHSIQYARLPELLDELCVAKVSSSPVW